MRTLRAAVIGLGVGAEHVRVYQEISGIEVTMVCDVDETRLKAIADKYQVSERTIDWRDVVAANVDIVSVCTPDRLHGVQAKALVESGKHVLCEKPMTTSLDEARELVELVYEHGVILAVGNVCRFVPQFALAADYAHRGKLGDLFFVEADYAHDMREVFRRTPWRIDPEHPQNAIYGGGVHPIDLLRWAAGEVVEVFAYGNHKTVPEYCDTDNILIALKFASGCVGKVWITLGIRQRPDNLIRFNLYGSQGSIRTDSQHAEAKLFINGMANGQSGWATIPLSPVVGHPFRAELEHFLDCVRYNRSPLVNVVQGARTVAVMAAAQASLQSGQPVAVESIPSPRQLRMIKPFIEEQALPPLPGGYALRTYKEGDAAAWLRICQAEFSLGWDETELRRQILGVPWFSPERMFFVTYQNEPVGVVCAWQSSAEEKETGEVHFIAVQPEHRGKGLGRVLMAATLRYLREHGFRRCTLLTDDFRWPAIKLYWSFGFRPHIEDGLDTRRWNSIMRRLNLS